MINKKTGTIALIVLVVIIVISLIISIISNSNDDKKPLTSKTIYVATGGGKEDFIADEEVNNILKKEYKLNVVYDSWSNGKTITKPLVREFIGEGNTYIPDSEWSIDNDSCSKYDVLFTSDERFYNYYKLPPKEEEANRYTVLDGSLTLNTPIVIYSWKDVADVLIKENIVTLEDNVYYITDMNKLLNYILEDKSWQDLGLDKIYGKINIASTDPVTSSPGATYYGLLLSTMTGGDLSNEQVQANLPKLKEFYKKSGYMNNTPADLFELYLRTGEGAYPMIVDYEKSIVDLANSDKEAYDAIKDKMVILYPRPTIWNSHCIATFTEDGNTYLKAFNNKKIQNIAWSKYGFRVGTTGGNYDVSKTSVTGIPQEITSVTSGLKMDTYNEIINYLSNMN